MQNFFHKTMLALRDKRLRTRILFTLGALILFRLLAAIPVPGIDAAKLTAFLSNNQFFGILNIFSGGGLSNLSIIMLGVGPFITASIIMQLLTIMVPRLKALYHEEGEAGRKKFTQYSRMLTVPLAIIQGFSFLLILQQRGILGHLTHFQLIVNLGVITAGSLLLMWIGELISEYGIGNGVSLIIFAGIISQIPTHVSQLLFTFDVSQIPLYIVFLLVGLLLVAAVIMVTEAERPIAVTYAKQVRGTKVYGGTSTYIPLRINQAGVIPIIFALSILLFPQVLANVFLNSKHQFLVSLSHGLATFVQNTWAYSAVYFVLVVLFTYFYTAITFEPESMATNLQKNGAFIPGIRPGNSTAVHISNIVTRITLLGAVFLGVIAVLPLIMKSLTGITAIALGGTALLIVVSVVLDLIKKIDAQISMREY
jgi:preprotein translocase subunit SecY